MNKLKFTPTKSDEIADKVQGRGGFVAFSGKDKTDNVIAVLLKGMAKIGMSILGIGVKTSVYRNEDTGDGYIEVFEEKR